MRVSTIVNGRWRQNCYVVAHESGQAIIVDPGSEPTRIAAEVEEQQWRVLGIVNTHGHFDHIGAVAPLQDRYGVPFYLHGADAALLKRANLYRMLFESRDSVRIPTISADISTLPLAFDIGPLSISWIATPGHTDGSVCLMLGNLLFSGDTLMRNAIGRTDLPGGNRQQLLASIRKLMALPAETVVYGGHGPTTTLAEEFAPGSTVWSLLQ